MAGSHQEAGTCHNLKELNSDNNLENIERDSSPEAPRPADTWIS